MENDLSAQYLLALLRQIVKSSFYSGASGEGSVDREVVRKIFSDSKMSEKKISDFMANCAQIFRRAAKGAWSVGKMEQMLSKTEVSEEHRKVFAHVWKTEGQKIHKEIVSRTIWNSSLDETSWRIDVKANSRHVKDINEPTAIVRLSIKKNNQKREGVETVHFEMGREELENINAELDKIQDRINEISS
ncbi:hypothetical protein AAMO2058_001361800 [Amorphochlora amoebiformis]